MVKKYIPTFGIEIHAELSTKTKAFSSSIIDFNSKPNFNISSIDLGYPGTKPMVNKKMVEYAYRLAKILEMNIQNKLYFDRKSYFYPDLSKGFQITQYFKPIGTDGFFTILVNGKYKNISITEIHMEEDTAKQINIPEGTLFDFNRAGIPLIEIVSGHNELSSIEEVICFVKQMRNQLVIMGINDGKLEEGSFRVDINISIRKEDSNEYGVRTEIKNLNSFNNIKKALNSEIKRQINILEKNDVVKSMTIKFDEKLEITIPLRKKDKQEDYNFIPEGNIRPITLNSEIINEFNKKAKNDIKLCSFTNKWKNIMNDAEISVITSSKKIFDVFFDIVNKLNEKDAINFIVNNIKFVMNESLLTEFRLDPNEIISLFNLRKEGKIDNKKTNKLIAEMFLGEISQKIKELNNKKLLSEIEIKKIIQLIISSNEDMIKKNIDNKPEKIEKFLMGQLMKETKGKVSPQVSNKIMKEILWEK